MFAPIALPSRCVHLVAIVAAIHSIKELIEYARQKLASYHGTPESRPPRIWPASCWHLTAPSSLLHYRAVRRR